MHSIVNEKKTFDVCSTTKLMTMTLVSSIKAKLSLNLRMQLVFVREGLERASLFVTSLKTKNLRMEVAINVCEEALLCQTLIFRSKHSPRSKISIYRTIHQFPFRSF